MNTKRLFSSYDETRREMFIYSSVRRILPSGPSAFKTSAVFVASNLATARPVSDGPGFWIFMYLSVLGNIESHAGTRGSVIC